MEQVDSKLTNINNTIASASASADAKIAGINTTIATAGTAISYSSWTISDWAGFATIVFIVVQLIIFLHKYFLFLKDRKNESHKK